MIRWLKNKNQVNLVIDAVMFLILMAITGLGLLMKYVLIPGYKRIELSWDEVELYFLGLDRHDWGIVHLWSGFIFLFMLSLHIILHWNTIVCICRKMISGKKLRISLVVIIGIAGLFLLLFPFCIKPEEVPFERKYRYGNLPPRSQERRWDTEQSYQNNLDQTIYKHRRINQQGKREIRKYSSDIIRVYNYMTLNEVSEQYNVSVKELAKELDIPANETDKQINTLRREYNFLLNDVRKAARKLRE